MEQNNSINSQITTSVTAIAELSEQLCPMDLGELAQIHENVEKINAVIKGNTEPKYVSLRKLCHKVSTIAEDTILESQENPEETLARMSKAIQHLQDTMPISTDFPELIVINECLDILDPQKESDADAQTSVPDDMIVTEATAIKPDDAIDTNNEIANIPTAEQATKSEEAEEGAQKTICELSDYEQKPLILSPQEFEYVESFLTECQEHIEAIEGGVLELEQNTEDLDKINELFRPFHTIKGMAGFLNLHDVQALTHEVETLLDLGRKGKLKITPPIIDLVFETLDVLKVQVSSIGQYIADPNDKPIPQPPIDELRRRLNLAARGIFSPAILAPSDNNTSRKLIGEILAESGDVSPELIEFALAQQKNMGGKPIGSILSSMGAVKAKDVSKALRKQNEVRDTVVRVDTAKLDSLVNMVGELVIIQTQVEQDPDLRKNPNLTRLTEQVAKITRDVQEAAMSMRMVPLAQTFHKMGRVVRDLSRKVNKQIDFQLEGEETELDKNVIQELSDPLMHMIRNAVDHGIENADERTKVNKPQAGTVKLKAYHQGGNIVIEISDDGKGLDKDKLLQKGIEKGLVDPNASLSEQQIYNLIMTAGFSTAEKITDISGRGVGMDVVKKNIEKMRGKVEIFSELGKGTTFIIKLPLTLAVIDGMIVRIGKQKFVIPTLSVIKTLSPTEDQLKTVQEKGKVLNLRDKLYPLLHLGEIYDIEGAAKTALEGMIVITQAEDQEIGLILDDLIGQQQVVIKSLGDQFKSTCGITGGAILGDGTIGLILEPAGLLYLFQNQTAA